MFVFALKKLEATISFKDWLLYSVFDYLVQHRLVSIGNENLDYIADVMCFFIKWFYELNVTNVSLQNNEELNSYSVRVRCNETVGFDQTTCINVICKSWLVKVLSSQMQSTVAFGNLAC